MIAGILNSLKEDRAKFSREVAYLREMAEEDEIDDAVEKAESQYVRESSIDTQIAQDMVQSMPEDYSHEESEEIRRIMEATDDMSFNEMIGLE